MKPHFFFLISLLVIGCVQSYSPISFQSPHIQYDIKAGIKKDSILILKVRKENISNSPTYVYGTKWWQNKSHFARLLKQCAEGYGRDTIDWPEVFFNRFAPSDLYKATNKWPVPMACLKKGESLREKYQLSRPANALDFVLVQRELPPSVFLRYHLSSMVMGDDSLWECWSRAYFIPIKLVPNHHFE